ncbi:DUF3293 domain-containing protein [Nitrosomonas communis]|uniref:DUF3293 domain-containing protein n=1 Tax=Nitrosomonas communis TaxID=44574 RepID=UPI0026F10724|nr:DUF3293 domain-containing protein [Nitrosomonas communis]
MPISNTSPQDTYRHSAVILDESLKQSTIPTKLIQNYIAAHYQATIDSNTLTLHIGRHCEPLSKLMKKSGAQCALYITACNPHSQIQLPEINYAANHRLRNHLSRYSNHIFTGTSLDQATKWPAEPSFLALGIDSATSKTLGKQFGQNAIVWVNKDAIPKLILLR